MNKIKMAAKPVRKSEEITKKSEETMKKPEKNPEEIIKIPMKYIILISAIIVGVLLLFVLVNFGIFGGEKKARENLISFFETNVPESEMQIVSSSKQGSFYYFVLSVDGESVPVYVTKDGKYLTVDLIPLK